MNIAILPLRAGSKGIPGKNRKPLLGRPLFCWALGAALDSGLDRVFVYSDDEEILSFAAEEYAWTERVRAIRRPAEDAGDGASTELAMLNLVSGLEEGWESITLLQATSPLVRGADIDAALKAVSSGEWDSALGVVRSFRFHWDEEGRPLNYDPARRPRRQDWGGQLVENGAVYCSSRAAFEASRCRVSGRIKTVEMPEDSLHEIDEPSDWPVMEALAERRLRQGRSGPPRPTRFCFIDADGTLTDGRASYGAEGELSKEFSLRDGMGLGLMRSAGIEPVIISSERSPALRARAEKLGIGTCILGARDKLSRAAALLSAHGASFAESAWIGDDINDLPGILACGWGICPADAEPRPAAACDLRLSRKGGEGAVREAAEFLISQNRRFAS